MPDPRESSRRAFLASAGLSSLRCEALPADASPRRYFRLHGGTPPALLLMDVAPPPGDLPAFVQVANHLVALGLSAPRVLRCVEAEGFALAEDFGMLTYRRALGDGVDERALYEQAVQTLAALHHHPQATAVDVPAYDLPMLLDEVALFADWYAPLLRPQADLAAFRQEHQRLWAQALEEIAKRRETLVLRDFHIDNLMLLPHRQGPAACGLLDFQDALIGARAYDLVSLCQDARRDLAPGLADHLVARYLEAMPALDPAGFQRDYWLLAAQRHAKVAGIFERLARRDGKLGYLQHQPRVLSLLATALQRAGLHALHHLLDDSLPGWQHRPRSAAAPDS